MEMLAFGKRITATVRVEFCYGHYLINYQGKCSHPHGHNAILEVTVCGVDSDNFTEENIQNKDMIVDFGLLKKFLKDNVEAVLDHKFLNELPYFKESSGMVPSVSPTAENMLKYILRILHADNSPYKGYIVKVRLSETPNSWVEWENK